MRFVYVMLSKQPYINSENNSERALRNTFYCSNMFRDLCQMRVIFLSLWIMYLPLALGAFFTYQDICRIFQNQVADEVILHSTPSPTRQVYVSHLPSHPHRFMNFFLNVVLGQIFITTSQTWSVCLS